MFFVQVDGTNQDIVKTMYFEHPRAFFGKADAHIAGLALENRFWQVGWQI